MIIDEEIIQAYVEEAEEHLGDIEHDLLIIEDLGANIDEEVVNKVFRAAHSIKGGAGFMGLTNIKELSHKLENILGMIRDREIIPNPDIVNLLLNGFDRLNELIANINKSNEMDISDHVKSLSDFTSNSLPEENRDSISKMIEIKLPNNDIIFEVAEFDLQKASKGGRNIYLSEFDLISDVHNDNKTPLDILKVLNQSGEIIESKIDIISVGTLEDDKFMNRIPFYILHTSIIEPDIMSDLINIKTEYIHIISEKDFIAKNIKELKEENIEIKEPDKVDNSDDKLEDIKIKTEKEDTEKSIELNNAKPEKQAESEIKTKTPVITESNIRVNVKLLDYLMNLAGELVLSRNQLLQSISSDDWHAVDIAKQRIDIVTSELQDAIMQTRMQPIGKIFDKYPRVVRDLARQLGKEVKLEVEGREVELDKSIIEGLNDPLTHMIRNSVDHGIETPADRRKAGKEEQGHLIMKAFHEAGQIMIEIIDDGKGINGELLAKKSVSKGLITEEQAKAMSIKEKINLIFQPGFSTSEQISDVSGRGVGMDVVKSNLDSLGGVVDVRSEVGKGTTIRIKLPLTLAIVPSLLISSGNERFAIPQVNLDELLRIPANQIDSKIELVGDAKVVRLREELLPILDLSEIIGIEKNQIDKRHAINIAVVSAGTFKYGLVVDELHDSEEIVVKPLGKHLNKCKEYAGATILGDGKVALILDVANIASLASLNALDIKNINEDSHGKSLKKDPDLEYFLLFRSSEKEQFAVPLNLVARIEKIKASEMEKLGKRNVIQYRGGSIPLFTINEVASVKEIDERDSYIVIVFTVSGKEFGLLATGPLDSAEVSVNVDEKVFKQPGILGSMVIGKHTTLLFDVYGFIEAAQPQWLEQDKPEDDEIITILLAEDTAFFRKQMVNFLKDEGFKVIDAEDGLVAWELLEKNKNEITIVLTDIEMPNMNGLELTKKIKTDSRFSKLPVIAVTSLTDEKTRIKGQKAGIDDYQVKLDRDRLLSSIRKLTIKN